MLIKCKVPVDDRQQGSGDYWVTILSVLRGLLPQSSVSLVADLTSKTIKATG